MATKKQRIRFQIAEIQRANVPGAGRNSAMVALIERRYKLSSDGVGGTRALGMHYSGADYWV